MTEKSVRAPHDQSLTETPRRSPPAVRLKQKGDGVVLEAEGSADRDWRDRLNECFGTTDEREAWRCLSRLLKLMSTNDHKTDQHSLNAVLASLFCLQPRDALEGRLMIQMILADHFALDCYGLAKAHQTVDHKQTYFRHAEKLSRTYGQHMETLKRYRSGGEQRIVVERVTINEGGQAIVGNVKGGGSGKTD